MNAWKVILPTLVIFIAGLVTGALLMTFASRNSADRQGSQRSGMPPNNQHPMNMMESRTRDLVRRMDSELDLTPEQRQHIETLVTVSQERTRELWKPVAPAFNKEFQHLKTEIRDQLNDDQKTKFDKIFKSRPPQDRRHPDFDSNNLDFAKPGMTNAPANP